MPSLGFSRVTIKSAMQIARRRATKHRVGVNQSVVRTFDGVGYKSSKPIPTPEAHRILERERIFNALVLMGVASEDAYEAATQSRDDGITWENVVGDTMHRLSLTWKHYARGTI